jgi:hypothetical protein
VTHRTKSPHKHFRSKDQFADEVHQDKPKKRRIGEREKEADKDNWKDIAEP